jgi:hypothetical protein
LFINKFDGNWLIFVGYWVDYWVDYRVDGRRWLHWRGSTQVKQRPQCSQMAQDRSGHCWARNQPARNHRRGGGEVSVLYSVIRPLRLNCERARVDRRGIRIDAERITRDIVEAKGYRCSG